MDELELFRDFRRGVAAPSEDARRRASAWRAAGGERRSRTSVLRLITTRPAYSVLALTALAGATAAALFLSNPWSDSPGFLERAEAALAPPSDTILHMKWEVTSTVTDPACSVTRGPNEIWIDLAPPHKYRAILDDPPPAGADPRALACSSGTVREVGGTVDPACSPAEQSSCTTQDTLEFQPPNTLSVTPLQFVLPPDPVTMLREAISAGTAHDEGKTQLGGRTVERIRIDLPSAPLFEPAVCAFPSCAVGHVYVDPETFHPVEMQGPTMYVMPPPDRGAMIPPSAITEATGQFDPPLARIDVVDRYLTFEYLPRTEANLALTDIRAQHPNATEIEW
jgi:hypothetical protein